MLKHFFTTGFRNIIRNRAFSIINIAGLSAGIACSLVIMLWVQDERSVDGFHKNGKELYQVYERNYYDGKADAGYPTQGLLAGELKKTIPEIQYASSTDYASAPGSSNTFEAGDKISKRNGLFAGKDFFSMFTYTLLEGTPQTALNSPVSIAISRQMADYFFGSPKKAIGKTIRFENKDELYITAVFENVPSNSSVQFDFLRSWEAYVAENDWVDNWYNSSPNTYVQLRKDADPVKVEAKIKDFIYNYAKRNERFIVELGLQPYTEKYLHSVFKNGYIDGGRIEYVRLFTLIAIFILIIACINFMNLATARSARRAKEVGVRKVIGAGRASLFRQFTGEAILLTFLSLIIAIALVLVFLPLFNEITGKQLSLPFTKLYFWVSLSGLLIVTGLVAGSYPAFFLSSLRPVRVLKGNLKLSSSAVFLRKGLVVFQFALSTILIIAVIVIYRQVNYIQNKNLGYDRENLVYVPIEGGLAKNYELFKGEAEALPGILSISKMRNSPTLIEHHTGDIGWPGKDPNLAVSFADAVVGYDFVKTMKLELKYGRDFSREFGTDSDGFILNETAVEKMGYKNPIGQPVFWGDRRGTIIGVVKDFHFSSMHQDIEPLIVRLDENWNWGTILVRTQTGKTIEALHSLESICKSLNPKFPFTYQFSDLEFGRLYKSEQVVSKLSGLFAFLAIFISCLGLFGLATLTAEQRKKEIGIRKMVGASVPRIIGSLSGSLLKPVAIAIVIAFPVAWLAMHNWLENYAYKTGMDIWVFGLAGLLTIIIALLTVCWQSIRVAIANPVKSLRAE